MGRKIPGRKHRGVRDLEKQRQDRINKLKDKVDAPPIDKNDQEIPKSLARIIELKAKLKNGEITKRKKKLNKKNMPVVFKPVKAGLENNSGPLYVQGKGESDRNFILRVNKVVNEVLKESAFEEKYRVNIKRDQNTGEVESVQKREKDPLEMFAEQLKKAQKKPKNKKKIKKLAQKESEQISKTQKKLKKKKQKVDAIRKDKIEDIAEVQHEYVKFGEVAHAPPTLITPKRVEKKMCAYRPGSKDLLLKRVLNSDANQPSQQILSAAKPKKQKVEHKVIDRKGKRKNLPVGLRRQLDKQKSEIVQAYKELKKQRNIPST